MQITETNTEGLKREFTVTVEAADIEKQVTAKLEELRQALRLPGFRPGKIPINLLRQRYGRSVMGEVLERAVNDSTAEAMRERNLRPALQPKVEIVHFNEGANLEYKMAVEILPEIQPMNFAELALERLKPAIPDEDVAAALERIAKGQRKQEKAERAAGTGDVVVIDFTGSSEGTPIPGAAATDYALELGSGGFIPGFEDQLIGASAGDERSFDITFPADYGSADLAGKAATFAVKVKEVRGLAEQAVDEALATALGLENLDELKKTVREQIERDYGRLARQKLKRDLLDRLAERHHFPVPDGMVQIEFDTIWKQVEDERKRQQEAGPAAAAATEPGTAAEPEPEKAAEAETAGRPRRRAKPRPAGPGRDGKRRGRRQAQGRIPHHRRAPRAARPAAGRGRTRQQHQRDAGRAEPRAARDGAALSRPGAQRGRVLSQESAAPRRAARAHLRGQGGRFHPRARPGQRARGRAQGARRHHRGLG